MLKISLKWLGNASDEHGTHVTPLTVYKEASFRQVVSPNPLKKTWKMVETRLERLETVEENSKTPKKPCQEENSVDFLTPDLMPFPRAGRGTLSPFERIHPAKIRWDILAKNVRSSLEETEQDCTKNDGPGNGLEHDVGVAVQAKKLDCDRSASVVLNSALNSDSSGSSYVADSSDSNVPTDEASSELTDVPDEIENLVREALEDPQLYIEEGVFIPMEGDQQPDLGSDATSKDFLLNDHPMARVVIPDLELDMNIVEMPPIWDKPPQTVLPVFKKELKSLLTRANKLNSWKYRVKSFYLFKDQEKFPKSIESVQPLTFDCPNGPMQAKVNEQLYLLNQEYKRRVFNHLIIGSKEYFEKEKAHLEKDYRDLFIKIRKYCADQGVLPNEMQDYLQECRNFFETSHEANKETNEQRFSKKEDFAKKPRNQKRAVPSATNSSKKKPRFMDKDTAKPAPPPKNAVQDAKTTLTSQDLQNLGKMLLNLSGSNKTSSNSTSKEAGGPSSKGNGKVQKNKGRNTATAFSKNGKK